MDEARIVSDLVKWGYAVLVFRRGEDDEVSSVEVVPAEEVRVCPAREDGVRLALRNEAGRFTYLRPLGSGAAVRADGMACGDRDLAADEYVVLRGDDAVRGVDAVGCVRRLPRSL